MIKQIQTLVGNKANPCFILVDGSYFMFHQFHSLETWWKFSHPNETIVHTDIVSPIVSITLDQIKEDFIVRFRSAFVNNVAALSKKLDLTNMDPILIIGKDCKRSDIWRNDIIEKYKGTRSTAPFAGAPLFKLAYKEELFIQGGAKAILSYPRLEADDCIAITTKHILSTYENALIYIITSDKDYLQLVEPRVKIFNLHFKNIAEQKSCLGDPKMDLFCKIVMGDASDNISSVLSKCGPKTALKCYQNPDYFAKRLAKENASDKYKLNTTLVDFNCIPTELIHGFIYGKLLSDNTDG